jgi:hypothetical protein
MKRELGLMRAAAVRAAAPADEAKGAIANLTRVSERSRDRVLQVAARSLSAYLQ